MWKNANFSVYFDLQWRRDFNVINIFANPPKKSPNLIRSLPLFSKRVHWKPSKPFHFWNIYHTMCVLFLINNIAFLIQMSAESEAQHPSTVIHTDKSREPGTKNCDIAIPVVNKTFRDLNSPIEGVSSHHLWHTYVQQCLMYYVQPNQWHLVMSHYSGKISNRIQRLEIASK